MIMKTINLKNLLLFCLLGCVFYCKSTTVEVSLPKENIIDEKRKIAENLIKQSSYYYQKKDYLKSIELADKSLKEYILFEGYYLKGMSYYQINDFNNGLKNLLLAEQIKPEEEQLLLTLGLIYSSLNQYEEALNRFLKLNKKNPNDPYYLYRIGLTYKEMQKYDEAISYLKKADREDFKYRNHVLLLLGDIYFELKDFSLSEYYYNELEKLNPKSEEVRNSKNQLKVAYYIEQGNIAFKNKKFKEAENYFHQVVLLKPEDSIGYFQKGILYLEIQDFDKAIENLKKALKITKKLDHFLYLCRAYLESQNYHEAYSCVQDGLKFYPESDSLLNLLAIYYKNIGNYKQSISVLNKILLKNEQSLNTHKNCYLIYLEIFNLKKAEYHLNKLREIDKENLNYWDKELKKLNALKIMEQGNEFLKKHQYNQAKKFYYKALENYQHPIVYIAIGDLYLKMGNYQNAENNYLSALKLSDSYQQTYLKLLDLYKIIKNKKKYDQVKQKIYQKSSQNLDFALLYINLLLKEKQYKEALELNNKLIKKTPNSIMLKKNLAYIYYLLAIEENQNKNFSMALNYINQSKKYDPENVLYHNTKEIIDNNLKNLHYIGLLEEAEKLFFREEYQKAKEIYLNLYTKWKKPLILVRLAEIEFYWGNELEGYKILNEALKEKPTEIPLLEALYTRLLELNRLEEAEKGFKEVIKLKEDAYFSYYKLGIIQLLKKNYIEALSYFDDAILYNPDFLPSKIGYGLTLYFLKDIKRSEEIFRSITEEKGFGSEIASLNVALIYLNKNELNIAKKELLEIIKRFPEYSDAYYHLAYIEYENRNFIEAEQLLKKAIYYQKKDVYYWALIKLYKEIGQNKKSLNEYCKIFLKTYPSSKYYSKVKEIYFNLNEEKQFYEISYTGDMKDFQILSFDKYFIFYNSQEILNVEKNSQKIQYHIQEKGIQSVYLNQFLWVIKNKEIKAFDPILGVEVWNKRFNQNICKLMQIYPDLILLTSESNCKENLFIVYQEKNIKIDQPILTFFNNNFLILENNEIYKIPQEKIFNPEFTEKNQVLNLNQERIKEWGNTESIFYVLTNEKFYIFDKDYRLLYQEVVKDKQNYQVIEDYLVKINLLDNLIEIMDLSQKEKGYFYKNNLDLLNNDLKNLKFIHKKLYLYLDSKNNLNTINLENKVINQVELDLKNIEKGIITLYY